MMSTVCICVLVTTAYPCIGPKWTPSNNNIGSLPRSLCSKHAKHSVSDLFPQILRSNSAAFFGMHRRSTVGDRSTSDLYDNDNTTTDPPCTVDHEQGTATQDSSPGPWRGCKGLLRKPFASWGVQRQGGKITRWAAQHITSPPAPFLLCNSHLLAGLPQLAGSGAAPGLLISPVAARVKPFWCSSSRPCGASHTLTTATNTPTPSHQLCLPDTPHQNP